MPKVYEILNGKLVEAESADNPCSGDDPGGFTVNYNNPYINDKVVVADSVEVDPAKSSKVGLKFGIHNATPGILRQWCTCTTVHDETKGAPMGAFRTQADGSDEDDISKVDVGKVVTPRRFRIRLWASQADWYLYPTPPPESAW